MAADQQRLALTEQTVASREQSQTLVNRRQAAGVASLLDVSSARAATETARGDAALLRATVAQDLRALRLLVGSEPPAALLPADSDAIAAAANANANAASAPAAQTAAALAASTDAATALVAVPANLSSTVLLQRPDVRAAEWALQAAQANMAAARAAMFPTIALTVAAGTASNAVSGLFGGGSGLWSFMPSIRLPIFDGGASKADFDGATVSRDIQVATYEKTVQTAFREAADALATRQTLAARVGAQEALVAAFKTNLRPATARQRLDSESPLAVLDVQRTLYTAQQGLIRCAVGGAGKPLDAV